MNVHRHTYVLIAGALLLSAAPPMSAQQAAGAAAGQSTSARAEQAFRDAQAALRRNDNQRAATLFRTVRQEFAQSAFAQDAGYWEAFALQRLGGQQNLSSARALLADQAARHPDAASAGDARALAVRIEGQLARAGDPGSAQRIAQRAESMGQSCPAEDEDERLMVLDALINMDSERALPALKQVLARRDTCSAALRRKAVFLVSRITGDETEDILLGALRNDPDAGVREQAVFWLGRTNSEKSTTALLGLVADNGNPEIARKAVFALSQQNTPRATAALRELVRNERTPAEVRGEAIFWIVQRSRDDSETVTYLSGLFRTLDEPELRERVLFSLSQSRNPAARKVLKDVALDATQPLELRRTAIFHAAQAGLTVPELLEIYRTAADAAVREQVIFAVSRKSTPDGLDALISIARSDTNTAMRSKAIFWIGQSKDPRAADFLLELLEKTPEDR